MNVQAPDIDRILDDAFANAGIYLSPTPPRQAPGRPKAELISKAEECANAGMTKAGAAKRLGLSCAYFANFCSKNLPNVKFKNGNTIHELEEYQECADRGLTQQQTATELGVSAATVSIKARKHGIHFRCGRGRR